MGVDKPQAGQQEKFLASPADIAIYGGAAGGGKTFGLLMEAARNTAVPNFAALFFRRNGTQISAPGGLWQESATLYPKLGAIGKTSPNHQWDFPSGAQIQMRHLQYDADVHAYQGSQIPLIIYDELTHFTRAQFFYMLSRNRSKCGVKPYVRATCNPDADSWVAAFIAWWIDQETGLPILERDGVLRYFTVVDDVIVWGDSVEEVAEKADLYALLERMDNPDLTIPDLVKSCTFIRSTIHDNRLLLAANPQYLANLMALPRVERARLLDGNWKVRKVSGMYFRRDEIEIIDEEPAGLREVVAGWDLAATEKTEQNDPDWTVRVKLALHGEWVIVLDAWRCQERAAIVRGKIKTFAEQDGRHVRISIPQDPGQAGKSQADDIVTDLFGWPVSVTRPTGDKTVRALPFATAWQNTRVKLVRGPWNEWYLAELEAFPQEGVHDDAVDASADAYVLLTGGSNNFDLAYFGR
ncbi:MAG: phage terminase large subunit [Paraburkholderia sp.]|jgi:predicted phage terminase large subunit-like protein|nr:phage terminase large subunit [Paraburkholderia sp.]